jgi:hypothetical protein
MSACGANTGVTPSDERLGSSELIAERYRGIRPAPGYPACPDHTAKGPLFHLLRAEQNASMRLTESFAMLPASSVSGFYLSHPDSSYFAVGKIGRDQVEDYARRSGISVAEAEKMAGAEPRVRSGNRAVIIPAWEKATSAPKKARSTRVATARSGRTA